ncbi:c2 domain-containing protein [Hordeum vulgare]|nr:c2 domain-containing protein [Hordeum vulgare]
MREALPYLGLTPGQNEIIVVVVALASTSSSATAKVTVLAHHATDARLPCYPHASCFFGDCSLEAFQALEASKSPHGNESFNLTHCWMIINEDENFKAQYVALKAREGKDVVKDHGMMTKKETRKDKRRQDKEEQMKAFLEIQRKRLEMKEEK